MIRLDELVEKYDILTGRRGMGFMQGIIVEGKPAGEIVKAAIADGLVILTAGTNVIRLVPPLVITRQDIDEMIMKLEKALSQ